MWLPFRGFWIYSVIKKTGEALIVSALPKMSSLIVNKEYEGMSLHNFYKENQEFFNNYQKQYPILTKIIDANDDFSVQVTPTMNMQTKA